ncbi:hypothetical protein, partial [Cohnella laeviribosi]|uniref:hypothetical protein n=1 Tax=Cohnella laeviribosi TaxID=380174 RepID=UPI001B7FC95B
CSFDHNPMCAPNLSIIPIVAGLGVYTFYFTDSESQRKNAELECKKGTCQHSQILLSNLNNSKTIIIRALHNA